MKYLYDKDFLQKLCSKRVKETFARITLLSLEDLPIEQIEGKITSGSVNIDGSSAVRRTCSLSMVTTKQDITDYYWSLKSKFKLELGLKNFTDEYSEYPIIWIPLGIYLISSFSMSMNTTQLTININGKDKMCQLNGEMGGVLAAPTDFGQIEEYDFNGNRTITKLPICQIIRDMIHTYANESYAKIIIEDIDDYGLNLETYRGNSPLYLFFKQEDMTRALTLSFDGNLKVTEIENPTDGPPVQVIKTLNAVPDEHFYKGSLISDQGNVFIINNSRYKIRKITYGQTVGYKLTNLVYPSDLIANAGETIVSVLDKIKKMLGSDFEYYYDIDGCFYFKKQNAYKSTNQGLVGLETDLIIQPTDDPIAFSFNDLDLIISINNNPAIQNIKNDFTVWGARKAAGGGNGTVPIHMRYAIDEKPTSYTTIGIDTDRAHILLNNYPELFQTKEGESEDFAVERLIAAHPEITYTADDYDWRELIYQMAKDYRSFNQINEFPIWLQKENNWCVDGKTGYERYYIDLEGFWRTLYQKTVNIKKYYENFIQEQNYIVNNITYEHNTKTLYIDQSHSQKVKDYDLYLKKVYSSEKQDTLAYTKASKKNLLIKWFKREEDPYRVLLYNDEIFYEFELNNNNIEEKTPKVEINNIFNDNSDVCNITREYLLSKLEYVENEIESINKDNYNPHYEDKEVDLASRNITVEYYNQGLQLLDDYNEFLQNENKTQYTYLGPLSNIIQTNYEIIKCRIQRAFIDMLYDISVSTSSSISNEDKDNANAWLDRIEKAYKDIVTDATLYIKDPNKRIKNANGEWEAPKDDKQYIGFTYAYARIEDFTTVDSNGKKNRDINSTVLVPDQEAGKIGLDEATEKILTDVYGIKERDLPMVRKSTLFKLYNGESGYSFLDFYKKYPSGFNKIGKYYDLNSLSDNIYIKNNNGEYQTFAAALNADTDQNKTLVELLELNHMRFNKILTIEAPTKEKLFELSNLNYLDYNQFLYLASLLSIVFNDLITYYPVGFLSSGNYAGWNENVLFNPEVLNFWFDILDSSNTLNKYSVRNIGPREKVTNNNNVKAIKYLNTPNNIFLEPSDNVFKTNQQLLDYFNSSQKKTGYTYFNLGNNYSGCLSISSQGTDAFTVIENQLYNFAQCAESITISCIPQYFLKPNTKIQIYNPELETNGTYILTKISIPLAYNGNMNLTATKALEEIITREEISAS